MKRGKDRRMTKRCRKRKGTEGRSEGRSHEERRRKKTLEKPEGGRKQREVEGRGGWREKK